MNSNLKFEDSIMKPSLIQSKWIYVTHDLELGRESYVILKMLQAVNPKVLV
jgi:hypothetical protein